MGYPAHGVPSGWSFRNISPEFLTMIQSFGQQELIDGYKVIESSTGSCESSEIATRYAKVLKKYVSREIHKKEFANFQTNNAVFYETYQARKLFKDPEIRIPLYVRESGVPFVIMEFSFMKLEAVNNIAIVWCNSKSLISMIESSEYILSTVSVQDNGTVLVARDHGKAIIGGCLTLMDQKKFINSSHPSYPALRKLMIEDIAAYGKQRRTGKC